MILSSIFSFLFFISGTNNQNLTTEVKSGLIKDSTTIGLWSYIALATPAGDVQGTITIQKEGTDKLIGSISDAVGNAIPVSDVKMENNKINGVFYYDTTAVKIEFTIDGDSIQGMFSVDGNQYKFNGKKK